MAEAVAEAIAARDRLVVEAGTGTGKTFAYLLPALLSGRKTIISTGTKALQDQLYHRDLPMLSKALGRPVRVALLKGRSNYLCLHRLALADQAMTLPGFEPPSAKALKRVRDWSAITRSGDVAEVSGIRDDDPVVFFEHKALYTRKSEVPDEEYSIPFGEADLVREGDDVTVVAILRMVAFAEKVVDKLENEGVTCDLIDPRTLSPLDEETILESVENTGRLVVVDESPPRCSAAADIAAIVASKGFSSLRAPIQMVTAPHTPVPFARELERAYVPGPDKIEAAIRAVLA